MAWLTKSQLESLGFSAFGENVLISEKAAIYGAGNISIGSNVRIDDFCVLSAGDGGIDIGSFIHIAVFSLLIGAGKIVLKDFSNISSRVSIYSSNDDYSGAAMTNPMVDEEFTNVTRQDVCIGRHVIIGSGSVILPGVVLEEGVAIGALSLIHNNCEAFGIYVGNPAKRIKERKKDLLRLEARFLAERGQNR
jgi:acetyltransferase-like isoleucine patch superfamily enzyme